MPKKGSKLRVDVNCKACGRQYQVHPCRLKKTKACSKGCAAKLWVRTAETRRKIGNATRGPRLATTGEKNYHWKGGSQAVKTRMARERDKDTCQCVAGCGFHVGVQCGFSDPYIMHVDHIKPEKLYPELALELTNLMTLCPNCHQYKTNGERRAKIFKVGMKKHEQIS